MVTILVRKMGKTS